LFEVIAKVDSSIRRYRARFCNVVRSFPKLTLLAALHTRLCNNAIRPSRSKLRDHPLEGNAAEICAAPGRAAGRRREGGTTPVGGEVIQLVCFHLYRERQNVLDSPQNAAHTLRSFGLAAYLNELLAYKGQNTRVSGLT